MGIESVKSKKHNFKKWVLKNSPMRVRNSILRKSIKLKYSMPKDWVLKVATTKAELRDSFELVHQAYVESGLRKTTDSRLRLTKYHLVPGSTVLVLKIAGKVVGTISLIPDSPLGTPLDLTWDISSIRSKSPYITAISSLAIHRDYRHRKGELLWPMLKFLYHFAADHLGTDYKVLDVSVGAQLFYESFLFGKIIEGCEPKRQVFANNYLAVPLFVDLKANVENFRKAYSDLPEARNLYKYFCEFELPNIQMPRLLEGGLQGGPFYSQAMENLCEEAKLWEQLTLSDLNALKTLHKGLPFEEIIKRKMAENCPDRIGSRILLRKSGELTFRGEASYGIKIVDVSSDGFSGVTSAKIKVGQKVFLKVALNSCCEAALVAELKWQSPKGKYGFKILQKNDEHWNEFVKRQLKLFVEVDAAA